MVCQDIWLGLELMSHYNLAFASLGKCLKVIVEHLMVVVTAAVCM